MKLGGSLVNFSLFAPEEEPLSFRTWFHLGRAIRGKWDARGPVKIPSDAFQLWKEVKAVTDKSDTAKIKNESNQELTLGIEEKPVPENI